MSSLEIEVKFFLPDIEDLERRIQSLGAGFQGTVHETNIRFETADNALFRQRSLLRLRRADRITLTYKSENPQKQGDYKVHTEYEASVDSFEAMENILVSLGFHAAQTYEKIRRTYELGPVELCLDTMPYGGFLEIEGPGEAIRAVSGRLSLAWEERILMNYLEMFEKIRKTADLSFTDVTFENFRGVRSEDMAALIRGFRAG
jgi:adenylate cyclase class 2